MSTGRNRWWYFHVTAQRATSAFPVRVGDRQPPTTILMARPRRRFGSGRATPIAVVTSSGEAPSTRAIRRIPREAARLQQDNPRAL
jgi:hypothetical protein